jgi:hypothetical protein
LNEIEKMKLELAFHLVENIRLAGPSRLEGRTLFVDPARIEAMVGADGPVRLTGAVALHPGERVRTAPVLDVVEPRAKEAPETSAFPGWTGPPVTSGHGLTRVLSGMAVAAVARLPGAQEGLIDMSPEATPYSPFSRTRNLVLLFEQAAGQTGWLRTMPYACRSCASRNTSQGSPGARRPTAGRRGSGRPCLRISPAPH